jgi:hypothetical protein
MSTDGIVMASKTSSKNSQKSRPVCQVCGKPAVTPICSACADRIRAEAVARKRREDKGLE